METEITCAIPSGLHCWNVLTNRLRRERKFAEFSPDMIVLSNSCFAEERESISSRSCIGKVNVSSWNGVKLLYISLVCFSCSNNKGYSISPISFHCAFFKKYQESASRRNSNRWEFVPPRWKREQAAWWWRALIEVRYCTANKYIVASTDSRRD